MPQPLPHIPALTGLRGIAAGWVALYHGWQTFGAPRLTALGVDFSALLAAGYFGVDLFFVLSGFLLGMPMLKALQRGALGPALLRFWQRRCLRVLPAYWFQIGVLALLLALSTTDVEHWSLTLASHLALLTNLFPFDVKPLNGVYWSLPVEWDFYLVLPLLAWSIQRWGWQRALPAGLLVALGYRWLCYTTVYVVPPESILSWWAGSIHQMPARLDQFLGGMFAAWLFQHRPPSARSSNLLMLLGVGALLLAAACIGPRGDVFSAVDLPLVFIQFTLLAVIFSTLCYAAAGHGRLASRLLSGRVLGFLGTVSYSLYLWHAPILHWQAQWNWSALGPAAAIGLTAVTILLVSSASYWLLERPFLGTHRHEGGQPRVD